MQRASLIHLLHIFIYTWLFVCINRSCWSTLHWMYLFISCKVRGARIQNKLYHSTLHWHLSSTNCNSESLSLARRFHFRPYTRSIYLKYARCTSVCAREINFPWFRYTVRALTGTIRNGITIKILYTVTEILHISLFCIYISWNMATGDDEKTRKSHMFCKCHNIK